MVVYSAMPRCVMLTAVTAVIDASDQRMLHPPPCDKSAPPEPGYFS